MTISACPETGRISETLGTSFDVREAVSNVKSYGEGTVMIWFLEDYRDDVVLVVRG